MTENQKPLWYTFANHSHWVDMEWLWGYQVQPDCIDDMLTLCRAVGAKGNVNFDAVGYEKLAAEDPPALARLREAVAAGTVEIVGGSYGQPYGLFLGGESNVRQHVFGSRVVRRLLGVWPRAFWEEEFDFFPQLPQILRGCGFEAASLFFQWTWHTPVVPEEAVPLVHWEGVDGSRLPALARTALCLHQWPEDFDGKLELAAKAERPALVQWVELMPSPDWMCRSELLLPRLQELFADTRFALRPGTLSEVVAGLDDGTAPVRRYTMDDVFHGMTIGKNADRVPRFSDGMEAKILAAEALAALAGLFGRPYASWDVWPAWELDEAWRELLQAQHHDNHECEALCGSVGRTSFVRAGLLAENVLARYRRHLAGPEPEDDIDALVVFNPLGWTRDLHVPTSRAHVAWGEKRNGRVARDVPPFGWARIRRDDTDSRVAPGVSHTVSADRIALEAGTLRAVVDRDTAVVTIGNGQVEVAVGGLRMRRDGQPLAFEAPEIAVEDHLHEPLVSVIWRTAGRVCRQWIRLRPEHAGVEVRTTSMHMPRPDGGLNAAIRLGVAVNGPFDLIADTPYAAGPIEARGEYAKKYPSGDWMTSPQWFETVKGSFTARTFVDIERGDAGGVLCIHDGSQGWFRTHEGVEVVLSAYDPWDEDYWRKDLSSELLFVPHGPDLTHTDRVRRAAEMRALAWCELSSRAPDGHPDTFGGPVCESANVLITAFYREHRKAFEHVANAFGAGEAGTPPVRNPYVVRLVEFDGEPADVVLRVPGRCPLAARTDLLGSVVEQLTATPADAPEWSPPDLPWFALRLSMRPHEIATVMLDLELGRHVYRNLDDHRDIWATVHRRD